VARVIALLDEARAAGLDVRRNGHALIVRGQQGAGSAARDLLAHKALVVTVLEHEDECRGHERDRHDAAHVDWRLSDDGRLVCSACRPERLPADPDGVMRAVLAADQAAALADQKPAPAACPTCGSAGRCEDRLPTTDGGWVCRHAVAVGWFRVNGQHGGTAPRREREADG
jgi:hypothetical protein